MILCVHGFSSNISALQFGIEFPLNFCLEWSWQHPHFARHGGNAKTKRSLKAHLENLRDLLLLDRFKRSFFHLHFNDADAHLSWLKVTDKNPVPDHMEHGLGELKDISVVRSRVAEDIREGSIDCVVCKNDIDGEIWLQCTECGMKGHVECWARSFIGEGSIELLPAKGICEFCESELVWGKMILDRKSIVTATE
jgi:hypothetical protein